MYVYVCMCMCGQCLCVCVCMFAVNTCAYPQCVCTYAVYTDYTCNNDQLAVHGHLVGEIGDVGEELALVNANHVELRVHQRRAQG